MRVTEIDLADVAAWPTWLKTVAHLALAGWVLGMGHWLVLGEQRSELAALARTGSDSGRTVEAKSEAVRRLAAADQRRAHLESILATALRRFPTAVDLPTLIEDLSRAAVDSGLVIESIHVSDDEPHDDYVAMPIALVVTGSYHQFGEFMAAAAGLERRLTFHDFEIEARGRPLTLTLAGRAYRAVDGAGGADAASTAGPVRVAYSGTGRSPFQVDHAPQPDDPQPEMQGKQPLERFALARLRMVGVLARRGVAVGLVRDPTGHVHRVGAGDRLGLHGGRIISVGFGGMEVVETLSDHTSGWARRVHRMEPERRRDAAKDEHGKADIGDEE
ncbi:MAG: pilus assembly protein PilP [Gammaproteobacteria bacterium]|nr:pilus assembly protein PilP [Gammaproteobacteria bacterium]